MSDVRALLKARRQEVRIAHPLASYTSSGQLRCIACGTIIKQGTSWDGHIGSKVHRTNAARLRVEERRQETEREERLMREKRKAMEVDTEEEAVDTKRRKVSDSGDDENVAPSSAPVGFPTDFFSDTSRAPLPPSPSGGEDGEEPAPARAPAAAAAPFAIDEEWEEFQAAVINAPDTHEAYDRATIIAEPVLAMETPEGFPPREPQADDAVETKAVLDKAEQRRRKEYDERELIMDRLLDEERAQEEADAKVSLLKSKLDALKRQREAARAAKGKPGRK